MIVEIKIKDNVMMKVDEEDWVKLKNFKWYLNAKNVSRYVFRIEKINGKNKSIFFHREIIGDIPIGYEVDHIDGDGLNNTRRNLRIVTRSQNQANRKKFKGSSIYKGVSLDKRSYLKKRWRASIETKLNNQRKFIGIGYYSTEKEAAIAYNEAAIKIFKNFARINKINP